MIKKLAAHRKDLALLGFISLFVSIFFWKVLFLAQPIAKVYLLGKRDVLFRRYFTAGPSGFDESVFLLLAPYYHLVASYWRDFQLPLWDPYCGWGLPLLGDVQAAVFSPFRLAFALNPSMYQYNFLLVLEVFCAAAGTYVFARHLRISKSAALFAAITYGFCPLILYFLELISGTSAILLPWIFWVFIRLGTQPSMKRAALCAVFCAVFIASGHPEASFLGIAFATLCLILLFSFKQKFLSGLRWSATVAPIALCLSAPVIIPFLEFFSNSDCYKFSRVDDTGLPVQGILLNLLQPIYWGASPYLGAFCIAFVTLACFVIGEKRVYIRTFLAGALIVFICICRPLFFEQLFAVTHASVVPGTYCIPVFLLLLTILSAFGLDYFLEHLQVGKNKAFVSFVCALLTACFVPAILQWCKFSFKSGNFGTGIPDMMFNSKIWLVTMVLALVGTLLLFLKKYRKVPVIWIAASMIALSFVGQGMANKLSLPISPVLKYDAIEPLPFLMEKKERVLALGFDVLCPNTNAVYRIASIGTHNVMQPKRYTEFIVACGAKNTTFNTLVDKVPLSKLIDYTGVKYVVSLCPVYAEGDDEPVLTPVKLASPIEFSDAPEIKLVEASVGYDARKAEARGVLKFDCDKKQEDRYIFIAVIVDEKGNPLWFGGLSPVVEKAQSRDTTRFSALVPATLKGHEKFFVGLQVFDNKKLKFLNPVGSSAQGLKTFGSIISLSGYSFVEPDKTGQDLHYRFVSESGPQRVRVYENTRSLGRAYFVSSKRSAGSPQEALKILTGKDFDGFSSVVLEEEKPGNLKASAGGRRGFSVPLSVNTPNRLEMTLNSPQAGYLVLTDTFFPGWTAEIDDKPVPILRANYLFRAVAIDAGVHKVTFSYRPIGFTIALVLFVIGLLVSALLCRLETAKASR
jgi:hypothetical protein